MAKKSKDNLKGMNEGDLRKELATLEEKLRTLKFTVAGSKSKNVKENLTTRRNIARVLTEINSRNK
jgi:ribosomal protein L29